jgi:hypothetical protein
MFLSVSEMGLDLHVGGGVDTMHAVKGVGRVRFQLESGGSLEVARVIYVPRLKLLSVSTLEDMGYAVMFEDGQVLIHSEGANTLDATVRLGIREGMIYRLLGQPMCGSKGILDCSSDQSAAEEVGGSSNSEGAATATAYLIGSEIDPGGGSSRSTFLAKREC